ncbi:hypothetical protein [Alteromonas sp. C1M14]|uniref:hypothetical protein n=1 Tax=Alteromonas sp. C1M14 TaxID=2841567 RepID=UPI001C0A2561|nr:hypothetical protein [Alteromonas sp. C1M14]MBU2979704.1 hypothetical protein [Alteromonas sp. C1M14]
MSTALMVLSGCGGSSDSSTQTIAEQPTKLALAESNWRQPLFNGVGAVNFPITTDSEIAQQYFNQGLALSYAFNHAAADVAFNEAKTVQRRFERAWEHAEVDISGSIVSANNMMLTAN